MLLVRPIRLTLAALAFFLVTACSPLTRFTLLIWADCQGALTTSGWTDATGVQLAVELRNKQGGIKGRKIVLIEADDQQGPKVACRAVILKYLIERKK